MRQRLWQCVCLLLPHRLGQALLDIPQDVVERLKADREPDQIRRHTGGDLLVLVHLAVRGRCRMNHQRLGITNIGHVREKLHAVDELLASCRTTLDSKLEHGTGAVRQVLLRQRVVLA